MIDSIGLVLWCATCEGQAAVKIAPGDDLGEPSMPLPASHVNKEGEIYTPLAL